MESKGLSNLKQKLFHKGPKEEDQYGRMAEIVVLCGGYNNFLETPIPTINELGKFCDWRDKRFWENMQRLFGSKRGGRMG